mgnify:CR=1 FL=1
MISEFVLSGTLTVFVYTAVKVIFESEKKFKKFEKKFKKSEKKSL